MRDGVRSVIKRSIRAGGRAEGLDLTFDFHSVISGHGVAGRSWALRDEDGESVSSCREHRCEIPAVPRFTSTVNRVKRST